MRSGYSYSTTNFQGSRKFLKERNLEVDVLVTDRHKQINKWLREAHPKIKHYYDIWHVAKGMCVSYSDIIE